LSTALVNGVALRYEIHGEGFPVVLLNGLGGNRKDWYEQVPVFSQHYQTITYDHRGRPAGNLDLIRKTLAGIAARSEDDDQSGGQVRRAGQRWGEQRGWREQRVPD
jgi:pimeloyl-ACP methyl ester carboxylesterase